MSIDWQRAIAARDPLRDRFSDTDCYRLFHGAVEGRSGTTVDRYGPVLLVQTWRDPPPMDALRELHEVAQDHLDTELLLVWNDRDRALKGHFAEQHPVDLPETLEGREHGLVFDVHPRHRGQDPLLFLDFRSARRFVRDQASGRSVLNLFAYTCGIGLAAAAGGASEVWNVDFARSALDVGVANQAANDLADHPTRYVQSDVFPVIWQLAGKRVGRRRRDTIRIEQRPFDLVVLDPPRWAKGQYQTVDVVRDYPSMFKPAWLATAPGGTLLATNNVASVDLEDWLDVLRRSAAKAGRPLQSLEVLSPDEDFPSPDGRHPLKIAVVR